ncbi:MAG: HAD-IC family P-type ATPase, partial [Thiobacillus sp.]
MKDTIRILRRNFGSPIVISIFTLAITLVAFGDIQDGFFLTVVITINTSIAVIQEIRASMALRKLELLTAPYAHKVQKDGSIVDVRFNELIVGDIVTLRLGDEVPADGEIISSDGLEINESILTGESRAIEKPNGSKVCGASAVVAGTASMRIEAIGNESQAGKMTLRLKRYDPQLTPIQSAIARTITTLTYGALFLAALIFTVYFYAGQDAVSILKTIAAAAGGVVPEGLLLASSLLLAYGSLRLAAANVLPQKLSAIEAMALLDVLCMDKTGTLTSDKVNFEDFQLFDNSIKEINQLVGIVAKDTSSTSTTGQAIIRNFPVEKTYNTKQTLAFSSSRKYSGIKVELGGKIYGILLGAPEYLEGLANVSTQQKKVIEELTLQGKRVLLVAVTKKPSESLSKLSDGSCVPVGIIILTNEFRTGAEKSVKYLQDRGVRLCVISGDNPNTVKYIASKVGIENANNVITGDELASINQKDLDKLVLKTGVFARVLPDQKERLIRTFKKLGRYTGMVGDGVNDALALKNSNLGVAMYQGAPATRRVADIVLLDNSFNSLPLGMRLGNQIIQAIELIAALFFHKIIFGVVLLIATLTIGLTYPFDPRHVTFMNIF